MANAITLELNVNDKGSATFKQFNKNYNTAMNKIKSATTSASKMAVAGFNKMKAGLASLKQHWMGLTIAVTALGYALKRLTDTYLVQERAEKMLADAMKLGGIYTREAHQEMLAYATALQQVTKYGDEATLQVMSLLETYRLNIDELKWATAASQDFASALGIDVKTAARYMGMALKGNIEMLARYIPQLKSTVTEELKHMSATEKVTFFIKLMNEQFGGRAQAEMKTYGGVLAWLGNLYGDVKEQIGLGVLESFAGENLDKAGKNMNTFGLAIIDWGERISKALFVVGHTLEGWENIFDTLNLGWLKLVEIVLRGQEKILSAMAKVTKVLQPEKYKEDLKRLAGVQQELVDVMQEQADITKDLGDRGEKLVKGYIEIENRFNGMRDAVKNVNYELLDLPENFELSVKDVPKKVEAVTEELESITEKTNEKIKENTASIWDEIGDIFKTTFTDATQDMDNIWDTLLERMKYKALDILGNSITDLFKGIQSGTGSISIESAYAQGLQGPATAQGNFQNATTGFAGAVDMFKAGVGTFVKGFGPAGLGSAGLTLAAGNFLTNTFAPSYMKGKSGPGGYAQGMKEGFTSDYAKYWGYNPLIGASFATMGLFGFHPLQGPEQKHMEAQIKRVEEFFDEYEEIMEKEYNNLVDMAGDFSALISHRHIEALEELGQVSSSQVGSLHALAEALGVIHDEAETAFAVSIGSMRRMETSAKQLALVIPEAADKIGAMTDKMQKLFMEDFMDEFERGLMDVDTAVKQLVRSGMSQLDAQTMLLGEDYNELIVMLDGSIEPIDRVSESFNDLYETMDDFDKLIAELPDSFGEVKNSLQELSYGLRYLLNMTQSLINTMDDLTDLPEIFESMGKAIEEGDWEQAAKDLYELQNIALEASSAFAQLGEALDYLKMAELGAVFTDIGKGLAALSGFLAIVRMIAEFFGVWDELLKGLQITFLEINKSVLELLQLFGMDFSDKIAEIEQQIIDLQKEAELVTDIFALWREEIEKMSSENLISDITEELREWQDIIDRFNLGDIKADMKDLLEDVLYTKMEIKELWDRELITPEQYVELKQSMEEAFTIMINEYFDKLLDSFDDFKDKLKRDMQELTEEGRTAKDVESDMTSLWKDMGKFTEEMDPGEFLANAEEMRGLILEKYAIEKAELEETRRLIEDKYNMEIAKFEAIKSAWMNVLDDVTAKLDSLKTTGMSQANIHERMTEQMSIIQRLEGEAAGETDMTKRAGIESQIASAYMDYLTMAEQAYQRPSLQYKEIYDMVVGKLEALQLEAQETISAADAAIISLNEEMKAALDVIDRQLEALRLQTIAELKWLSDKTVEAKEVVEGMRDDALTAIELDIASMEEYLSGEKVPAVSSIEAARDMAINATATNTSTIAGYAAGMNYYLYRLWNDGIKMRMFKEGTEYVQETGPAIVHKGEQIIPAGQSRDVNLNLSLNVKGGGGSGKAIAKELEHEVKYGRLGMVIKDVVRPAA